MVNFTNLPSKDYSNCCEKFFYNLTPGEILIDQSYLHDDHHTLFIFQSFNVSLRNFLFGKALGNDYVMNYLILQGSGEVKEENLLFRSSIPSTLEIDEKGNILGFRYFLGLNLELYLKKGSCADVILFSDQYSLNLHQYLTHSNGYIREIAKECLKK